MSSRTDVLVVGGGPAALSAAAWLRELDVPYRWWCDAWGRDTLARVGNPVSTYPGVGPCPGRELGAVLRAWARDESLEPTDLHRVSRCRPGDVGWRVDADTPDGLQSVDARTVVLATGTRPRLLGLEREHEFLERGVEISVTRRRDDYHNATCVVVGGGDAALEGALLLAEVGARVHVVHRRASFRGQRRFVDAILANDRIDTRFDAEVTALRIENDAVVGVELDDGSTIDASGVFERIGVEPLVPDGVPSDAVGAGGYIVVDATGRTPAPGLYACGDVCSPAHQSVAWSVGLAARTIAAVHEDLGY